MAAMKLYTRQGDQGKTSLLGGARVPKTDPRIKACGAVDELQAHLGLARAMIREARLADLVKTVQYHLLTAGAHLAATPTVARKLTVRLTYDEVTWLEETIDGLSAAHGLPAGFVLSGESAASAAVHVARAVCRRCERIILMLPASMPDTLGDLRVYFNRLADLLFALAWALEVRHRIRQIVEALLFDNGQGEKPCH